MSRITVGDLIDRLSEHDRDSLVAITSTKPLSCKISLVVLQNFETGNCAVNLLSVLVNGERITIKPENKE